MIRQAVSQGVWKRADQYPAQFLPALGAVPWPTSRDLAAYPYLGEAMALLEESWGDIALDLADVQARFAPNPEGAHDPSGGSWDAFTVNCTGEFCHLTPKDA